MDIGKAFSYIGEDSRWSKKLLIAAIVMSIPIINFMGFGYQIQIIRNVAAGNERPLPEWEDFGTYFIDGLRYAAVLLLYNLPMFLLMFVLSGLFMIVVMTTDGEFLRNPSSQPPVEFFIVWGAMISCITPYTLLIQCLSPIIAIQIARKGTVRAGFEFGEMWRQIRAQPVGYLLIVAIIWGLGMALSFVMMPAFVLIFIPCLGMILFAGLMGITRALIVMVQAHLQGQFIAADQPLPQEPTAVA